MDRDPAAPPVAPAAAPTSPTLPAAAPRLAFARLAVLYVAAGAPYALLTEALPGMLRREGADNARITALVADLGLPWTLKFLWAPLVDARFSRRAWIVASQVALAILFGAVAWWGAPSASMPAHATALLVGIAIASATQDIAADAFSLEAFRGKARGHANGLRSAAYRIGIVLGGGFLVARAASFGWSGALTATAVLFALVALHSATVANPPREPSPGIAPALVVRRLFHRKAIALVLLFALLFKAGDAAMAALLRPFLVDSKWTDATIGDVYAPLVIVSAIGGSLVGGWYTARAGLWRSLLVLGGLQAVSNLAFAFAAATHSDAVTWAAAAIEPFCGGLGAAAFITFLMASCDERHAAAHYAIWTAVMSLGKWLIQRWSGAGANALGYTGWFAATFVLALPALALLPALRRAGALDPAPKPS